MEQKELLAATDALLARLDAELARGEKARLPGFKAEVVEFLRLYGGNRNAFVASAEASPGGYEHTKLRSVRDVLGGFRAFVQAGLHASVSPARRAELDVVSDFLAQAQTLLRDSKVHPAAPTVLIGASLEEFLRTWVEAVPLSIGTRKPGLQAYAEVLRDADLLTKQDLKVSGVNKKYRLTTTRNTGSGSPDSMIRRSTAAASGGASLGLLSPERK